MAGRPGGGDPIPVWKRENTSFEFKHARGKSTSAGNNKNTSNVVPLNSVDFGSPKKLETTTQQQKQVPLLNAEYVHAAEKIVTSWISDKMTISNITDLQTHISSHFQKNQQQDDVHKEFQEVYKIIKQLNEELPNIFDNYLCFSGREDELQMKILSNLVYERSLVNLKSKFPVYSVVMEPLLAQAFQKMRSLYSRENQDICKQEEILCEKISRAIVNAYEDKMKEYAGQGQCFNDSTHERLVRYCISMLDRSVDFASKINNVPNVATTNLQATLNEKFVHLKDILSKEKQSFPNSNGLQVIPKQQPTLQNSDQQILPKSHQQLHPQPLQRQQQQGTPTTQKEDAFLKQGKPTPAKPQQQTLPKSVEEKTLSKLQQQIPPKPQHRTLPNSEEENALSKLQQQQQQTHPRAQPQPQTLPRTQHRTLPNSEEEHALSKPQQPQQQTLPRAKQHRQGTLPTPLQPKQGTLPNPQYEKALPKPNHQQQIPPRSQEQQETTPRAQPQQTIPNSENEQASAKPQQQQQTFSLQLQNPFVRKSHSQSQDQLPPPTSQVFQSQSNSLVPRLSPKSQVFQSQSNSLVPRLSPKSHVSQPPLNSLVPQPPSKSQISQPPLNSLVHQPPPKPQVSQSPLNSVVIVPLPPSKSHVSQPPLNSPVPQPPSKSQISQSPLNSLVRQPPPKSQISQSPLNSLVPQPPPASQVSQSPPNSVVPQPPPKKNPFLRPKSVDQQLSLQYQISSSQQITGQTTNVRTSSLKYKTIMDNQWGNIADYKALQTLHESTSSGVTGNLNEDEREAAIMEMNDYFNFISELFEESHFHNTSSTESSDKKCICILFTDDGVQLGANLQSGGTDAAQHDTHSSTTPSTRKLLTFRGRKTSLDFLSGFNSTSSSKMWQKSTKEVHNLKAVLQSVRRDGVQLVGKVDHIFIVIPAWLSTVQRTVLRDIAHEALIKKVSFLNETSLAAYSLLCKTPGMGGAILVGINVGFCGVYIGAYVKRDDDTQGIQLLAAAEYQWDLQKSGKVRKLLTSFTFGGISKSSKKQINNQENPVGILCETYEKVVARLDAKSRLEKKHCFISTDLQMWEEHYQDFLKRSSQLVDVGGQMLGNDFAMERAIELSKQPQKIRSLIVDHPIL